MPELYVRPPLVPHEPPSAAWASWRFRVAAAVLLLAMAALVIGLFLRFSNVTAEDPGFGVGLGSVTAPTAPAAR